MNDPNLITALEQIAMTISYLCMTIAISIFGLVFVIRAHTLRERK